ncbi:FUSC family membrane protein [Celerinatantimonas sp. MCCC 1A17872]|uniref:FUSC family membrane protein n=1 Tax=Celerinatantimonas sp. MCCC 1A17872 TaxID=3177514 RepID=UPI0038C9ECFC
MQRLLNYLKPPRIGNSQFGIATKATVLIVIFLLGHYLNFSLVYLSSLAFGVVAAALADHPALYVQRIKAIVVMLGCFALASYSVTLLYPYPWLFAAGIFSSTFLFIMLASLEVQFGPIAMSALILAIYTMLGYGQYSGHEWDQPLFLLLGAGSYILLSVIINVIKPNQSLAQNSSEFFTLLAKYQSQKAQFFANNHNDQVLRLNLAKLASQTAAALAQMRKLLVIRQAQYQKANQHSHYLDLFYKAQLLFERVVSSHVSYQQLNDKLAGTDISQRLYYIMQGLARRISFQAKPKQIHDRLKHEIATLAQYLRGDYQLKKALGDVEHNQLSFMLTNLSEMERLTREEVSFPGQEFKFEALSKLSWTSFWQRIRQPKSLLFRHALRQALCMLCGYGIIMLLPWPLHGQDFWLLLTTLLVIKPNYSATRQRLAERIIGTLIGVAFASALLMMHIPIWATITITAISALLFFWYFSHRYAIAVVMITVFVALALQLLGVKSELTVGIRTATTLLGGILVFVAVRYIWPDWLQNHTARIISDWLSKVAHYQDLIFNHYQTHQAREDEEYRLARFHMHLAEADVVTHQQALMAEPATKRQDVLAIYQLTGYMHAYCAHLSALALYRGRTLSDQATYIINHIGQQLHAQLQMLQTSLSHSESERTAFIESIQLKLRELIPNLHGEELLIAYQLQQLSENLQQLHRALKIS